MRDVDKSICASFISFSYFHRLKKYRKMNRFLSILLLLFLSCRLSGQVTYDRIEPPFWWTGMQDTTLQLLIHGNRIAESDVIVDHRQVRASAVKRVESPDYLVLDLSVPRSVKPGKVRLIFQYQREVLFKVDYELMERNEGSSQRQGFGREDVIYLLMPDRFSNGDPSNDSIPGMLQGAHRDDPDGRHGGDIKGIADQAGYLKDLGITGIWINPLLENNQLAA